MTLAALLTLSSSSCATYHAYQIGGPDGRELGNQASTEWKGKTLNAFAWGLVRQDLAVDVCRAQSLDGKGGFEEVKIETNALYILASVVTLGIWIPLKVSYRCAKPSSPTGTLGGGR
jgi:hypothetical protein